LSTPHAFGPAEVSRDHGTVRHGIRVGGRCASSSQTPVSPVFCAGARVSARRAVTYGGREGRAGGSEGALTRDSSCYQVTVDHVPPPAPSTTLNTSNRNSATATTNHEPGDPMPGRPSLCAQAGARWIAAPARVGPAARVMAEDGAEVSKGGAKVNHTMCRSTDQSNNPPAIHPRLLHRSLFNVSCHFPLRLGAQEMFLPSRLHQSMVRMRPPPPRCP
jgi:hypothetical protein